MESNEARIITIPYVPRVHFTPLHISPRRFIFVVAHRRAGKTVAEVNHLIRAAARNDRKFPPPRYGYVGPSFAQAKELVWGYTKYYTGVIPNMDYSEGELWAEFPNGARLTLYGGAAAYERMRGLYFDGIVIDEFPLVNPSAWTSVVRPCLADYKGWAIVSGTSNGEDHFYKLKLKAENDPDWDVFVIPVTETDCLDPDEIIDLTKDMSADEYAREMLCSFSASVEGAYYAEQMNAIELENRICRVPYDSEAPVWTWWDLGIDDNMAIWFAQRCGREIHIIDYIEDKDKKLSHYTTLVKTRGYEYAGHVFPPDIKVRELISGSRHEFVCDELGTNFVNICPPHSPEDGINATRNMLGSCFFNEHTTHAGVNALRGYHKNKMGKPAHDKPSHGADAMRYGSIFMASMGWGAMWGSNVVSLRGALRRNIAGVY